MGGVFFCQKTYLKLASLQSTSILVTINFPMKKGDAQILIGQPLSHIGQARQCCPKLTYSGCANLDFLERYMTGAEKHQ